MNVLRWSFIAILIASLQYSCNNQKETKCLFIVNQSNKIKLLNIDSSCYNADMFNNNGMPLFVHISDSIPSDPLKKFYYYSSLKNKTANKLVVLFIDDQNSFTVLYSENLKTDALLRNRYEFSRFVHDELKQKKPMLELTNIFLRFETLFIQKS